jgi:hypothetical protein
VSKRRVPHKEKISVGRLGITVAALQPLESEKYGLLNWSLKSIQNQKDADAKEHFVLVSGLKAVFKEMGLHRVFAPNIAPASARIIDTRLLKEAVNLGEDIVMYRNQDEAGDGVFLGRGTGIAMGIAGCPAVIATAGEQMIVAHAGRDSLIDRGAVLGEPTRRHVSIVDAIIEAFLERGISPNDIVMCMLFAIPAKEFVHSFSHPEYGLYNYRLCEFIHKNQWSNGMDSQKNLLYLDLEMIFQEQARQNGVQNVFFGCSLDEFPALVHTRDGGGPNRRNLVVIKRNQAA